jgi:predicted XRE-type DNA-binding protein
MMDWKKLLQDLADARVTQVQIAERCGVKQSTVSELARGVTKEPQFSFGSKLQAMHAELTPTQPQGEVANAA